MQQKPCPAEGACLYSRSRLLQKHPVRHTVSALRRYSLERRSECVFQLSDMKGHSGKERTLSCRCREHPRYSPMKPVSNAYALEAPFPDMALRVSSRRRSCRPETMTSLRISRCSCSCVTSGSCCVDSKTVSTETGRPSSYRTDTGFEGILVFYNDDFIVNFVSSTSGTNPAPMP